MKFWTRKRKPDPVSEAVEEQSALARTVLSRVDRVLRSATETLGTHDAAAIEGYTQAESERTRR